MNEIELTIDNDEDFKSSNIIRAGILAFNEKFTGTVAKKYCIVAKQNNKIIGGAIAYHDIDSIYVDILWLDESFRHQGLGTKIMRKVEMEALKSAI